MQTQPFELNYQQGKPLWMIDILWVVLADQVSTDGRFSLMWELCPKGSGPGPHYHNQDEGFFVTEGQITYLANGEKLVAKQGSFVWIPRGTVHAFRVDSETATLLNLYTPAGFEQAILAASFPAESFTLPPKGIGSAIDRSQLTKIFDQIGMHVVREPDVLRATEPN